MKTNQIYTDEEILGGITSDKPRAALTAYVHIQSQTKALGDEEEGYIIVPKKQDWRTFKI